MYRLKLNEPNLSGAEVLTREQLRSIKGGIQAPPATCTAKCSCTNNIGQTTNTTVSCGGSDCVAIDNLGCSGGSNDNKLCPECNDVA